MARAALDALYDSRAGGRPVVTLGFLLLCYAITVPTLFKPELYGVFGGIAPRSHGWQIFTAAFEHGWPGFHGSIHLALDTFLILEAGPPCERLLGRARFLGLCLAALAVSALVQTLTGGVNGSSLIIWSWGPPLFFAWRWGRRHGVSDTRAMERLQMILVFMYGVMVAVMTVLPYLAGWRGNPLVSLIRGNLFHLTATGVGIVFTAAVWRAAGARLERLGASGGNATPDGDSTYS